MELHHLLFIIACPPTTSLCLHLNQLVLITINQPMDHRYIISVVQLIHQRHQPTAQQGMNKLITIHFILLHNCKYVLSIILLFSIQSCLLSDFTSLFADFTCLFADFTSLFADFTSLLTYISSLLTDFTSVFADFTSLFANFTCLLADFTCLLADFTRLFANFTCLLADFTRLLTYITSLLTYISSLLTYITSLLTYITSLLTYITSLLTYIFRKQVKHIFLISFPLLIIATLFFYLVQLILLLSNYVK